jgi:hypothetical protein
MRQRVFSEEEKAKRRARSKAWREANPDRQREHIAAWKRRYPMRTKDFERRRKFGLPLGQYEAMLAAQENRCLICKGENLVESKRSLAVDHDHNTGAIRGLLCYRCNVGLGYFLHDPQRLASAISYLSGGKNV